MHLDDFEEAGIQVRFQRYNHPIYEQHTKREFEPYLSTLDLLVNVPLEEARILVKEHGEAEK